MSREGCEKPKGSGEPRRSAITVWWMPRENFWEGGNGHPSPCCEQVSQGRPGKCELYLAPPFESDSREELEQEWVCVKGSQLQWTYMPMKCARCLWPRLHVSSSKPRLVTHSIVIPGKLSSSLLLCRWWDRTTPIAQGREDGMAGPGSDCRPVHLLCCQPWQKSQSFSMLENSLVQNLLFFNIPDNLDHF